MHADNEGKLILDQKQNCDNFHLDMQSQSIVFERYFDTCDADDYLIEVSTEIDYVIQISSIRIK